MTAVRTHTFAKDRPWERYISGGYFHDRVVPHHQPTAVGRWVPGGFVWREDGRIVAELEMRGAKWFGWVGKGETVQSRVELPAGDPVNPT